MRGLNPDPKVVSVKPQRDIPVEWAEQMERLGFVYRDKPSARALADAAGVTVGAALRVIFRENYGEDTALALGRALRNPEFVAGWVAMPLGETYEPPSVSRMLTPQQRVLVDELIRELARKEVPDAGDAEAEKIPVTRRDQTALAARRHRGAKDRIRARDDESGMDPA